MKNDIKLSEDKNIRFVKNEWEKSGIQKGQGFALLTDEITRAWTGIDTRQYKNFKDFKKKIYVII